MTQMKRRGFLGGIAAALATTPEKVLKASGVQSSPIGGDPFPPSPNLISPGMTSVGSTMPWWKAEKARIIALRTFAPWLLEKKRRRQARYVHVLDVNISCLRSVSPAAKIAMQRELQYRRQLEAELEGLDLQEEEMDFHA